MGVYRLKGRSAAVSRCDAEIYRRIPRPLRPTWDWWVDRNEDEDFFWGEGNAKTAAQAKREAERAFLRCLGPITEEDRARLVRLDDIEEKKGLTKKQKAEVLLLAVRLRNER